MLTSVQDLSLPLCYCPCLSAPALNLAGPSSPSSYYDLHQFSSLYFCDECDAIRCEKCVRMDILTYYCPSCGFEVPAASVRGEKARCARHCFNCPRCDHTVNSTISTSSKTSESAEARETEHTLYCQSCKWTSSEGGQVFAKPTGVGRVILEAENGSAQAAEFDRLQAHFERHIANLASALANPKPSTNARGSRYAKPSRYIASAIRNTQGLAPKSFSSPSMTPAPENGRHVQDSVFFARESDRMSFKQPHHIQAPRSEDLAPYRAQMSWEEKANSVTSERTKDLLMSSDRDGPEHYVGLEQMWDRSWMTSARSGMQQVQRLPLLIKITKRCSSCNHTLVKPDVKRADPVKDRHKDRDRQSYKIKLVAASYLPQVELGNRRRLRGTEVSTVSKRTGIVPLSDPRESEGLDGRRNSSLLPRTSEDLSKDGSEARRSVLPLRGIEESEKLDAALRPGISYTYQLGFTNPLEGDIDIRLSPMHLPHREHCSISFPDLDFKVGHYMEAWEMDEEDDESYGVAAGSRAVSGSGSTSVRSSRPRVSVIGRPSRATGLERRGNTTKVGFIVSLGEEAVGRLAFDLQVAFTYQAEEEVADVDAVEGRRKTKKVSVAKQFSFMVRVDLGEVRAV